MEADDEVQRLSTQTFDRLSNDVSGFGPMHREKSSESESDCRDDRQSCTTTGFDFYVNNMKGLNNATSMINRERDLFSPPFKTRAERPQ